MSVPPPIWIQWVAVVSVLIAGLGLVVQSITFFVDRYDRRKDLKRSRFDDYWFRQILLPVCVNPLIELAHSTIGEITGLHQIKSGDPEIPKRMQGLLGRFASKKMQIVNSALLLTIYGDELYDSFSVGLDELQDGVEEHVSKLGESFDSDSDVPRIISDEVYIQQFVWIKTRDVIQKIMKHHETV